MSDIVKQFLLSQLLKTHTTYCKDTIFDYVENV